MWNQASLGVACAMADVFASSTPAAAQYLDPGRTRTDRDAHGHRQGIREPRSGGGSILRDAQGRRLGTMEPGPSGTLIERDAQGRSVALAAPPPPLAACRNRLTS